MSYFLARREAHTSLRLLRYLHFGASASQISMWRGSGGTLAANSPESVNAFFKRVRSVRHESAGFVGVGAYEYPVTAASYADHGDGNRFVSHEAGTQHSEVHSRSCRIDREAGVHGGDVYGRRDYSDRSAGQTAILTFCEECENAGGVARIQLLKANPEGAGGVSLKIVAFHVKVDMVARTNVQSQFNRLTGYESRACYYDRIAKGGDGTLAQRDRSLRRYAINAINTISTRSSRRSRGAGITRIAGKSWKTRLSRRALRTSLAGAARVAGKSWKTGFARRTLTGD